MASDLALTLVKNFKAIPVSLRLSFSVSLRTTLSKKAPIHCLSISPSLMALGGSPFNSCSQFGAIDRIWQGFERTSDPQLNQFKQAIKSINRH